MRSFNGGGVCTYGLNNQTGYLFERSQNALRQRSFGRARGFMDGPTKRKTRDQDEEEPQRELWQRPGRRVLDGIKRMRLSLPLESPKTEDMTDEEAATPRTTWRTDKAIAPVSTETYITTTTTRLPSADALWKQQQPVEIPTDASCRAMVVFNPYQSMTFDSKPRVELVESEEEKQEETESEGECVRFEELSSDNEEAVDMDVD